MPSSRSIRPERAFPTGSFRKALPSPRVGEPGGMGPPKLDLAQLRAAPRAGVLAHIEPPAPAPPPPGLPPAAGKPGRPVPKPGLDEDRALLDGPIVQRRLAYGLEVAA